MKEEEEEVEEGETEEMEDVDVEEIEEDGVEEEEDPSEVSVNHLFERDILLIVYMCILRW